MAEDFTEYEFCGAFRGLCAGKSVRGVAAKQAWTRNMVHGLMTEAEPLRFNLWRLLLRHSRTQLLSRISGGLYSQCCQVSYDSPETASLWFEKFKVDKIEVKCSERLRRFIRGKSVTCGRFCRSVRD